MSNYQLNAGDSVVVTVTDTDDVTGLPVTPDAGSVTAVLSSTTDTISAHADGTYTITAGPVTDTGNTVTVNATAGGVASKAGVGTYDVVPAVVPATTTLSVSFGTESAPGTTPVGSTGTLPVSVTLPDGAVLPAGAPLPAGTHFVAETGELLDANNNAYVPPTTA